VFFPMASKKAKILIVEDEYFLLDFYETKLEASGFKPIKAGGGAEGIRMAKKKLPDLIILDILMPEVDGFQVLQAVKADQLTKDIPVLILSNLSQRREIKKGLELGAEEFVVKADVIPDEIVDKINKYLNASKPAS